MDQALPAQDFCPQHLASMAQAGTLSEDKTPRQGARKTLWLTLLASLLAHALLLTLWAPRPAQVKAIAPDPNLRISLNAAVTDTSTAQDATPQQEPAVEEEPITTTSPAPSLNSEATEETTSNTPRIDIHTLDITPSPLPPANESGPGNVFHPGLRDRIRDARARRERLHGAGKQDLRSWQDASGKT